LVDWLTYLAVRTFVCFTQMLSISEGYRLADALASIVAQLDRRHRRVAMENLERAFGTGLDRSSREALAFEVYRHLCRMMIEMLHIPRILRLTTWRRHVRLVGHEAVLGRFLRGGPTLLLSGHYGNWELASYMFGVFGFPPVAVARPLDNPHLDRFVRDFRLRATKRLIAKQGGSEEIIDVLSAGGSVSMLADQDAGPKGLFVSFFGSPASTFKAIALLAMQFGAPTVVGVARRLGPGFRYEVRCEGMLDPKPYHADLTAFTQDYTSALERLMRLDPGQYLWLHRRWKHQPKPRAPKPHPSSTHLRAKADEGALTSSETSVADRPDRS
jgi:KDO2-lipid IV(A) lauroyltransferase